MKTVNLRDFLSNSDDHVINAALDNEYVKITTDKGNAVLISEAEYNILRDSFKILCNSDEVK